jgi:hypothetical protein
VYDQEELREGIWLIFEEAQSIAGRNPISIHAYVSAREAADNSRQRVRSKTKLYRRSVARRRAEVSTIIREKRRLSKLNVHSAWMYDHLEHEIRKRSRK